MGLASFGIGLGQATQAARDTARQTDADALGALRAEDAFRAEQDRQGSLKADRANPLDTTPYAVPAAGSFAIPGYKAPPTAVPTRAAPVAYSPTGSTASPWAGRTAQPATDHAGMISAEQAKLDGLRAANPASTPVYSVDDVATVPLPAPRGQSEAISASEARLASLREAQATAARGASGAVPGAAFSSTPTTGAISKEAFIAALAGQESNNGKMDTSKPNYAGAIGPMQIIESTFNGLKAQGRIPQDANWRNPADSAAAGRAFAGYLYDKNRGDTRKSAAEYYTGEANVAKGNYLNLRDNKNPKAPTVGEYIDQIHARINSAAPGVPDTATATAPTAPTVAGAPASPAGAAMGTDPAMMVLAQAKAQADPLVQAAQQHMKLLEARFNGTSNLQARDAIRAEYNAARAQAYDGQLISLGHAAGTGNQQALGQLVQIFANKSNSDVGVATVGPGQYVFTQQGEDGKRVAASAPLSAPDIAQHLLQFVSPSMQARAIHRATTEDDARAKASGEAGGKLSSELAKENNVGQNARQLELIKGSHELQKALLVHNLSGGEIKSVTANPMGNGYLVAMKDGRIGTFLPGATVNGVTTDAHVEFGNNTGPPPAGLNTAQR